MSDVEITIEDYENELKSFNFYYDMIDDYQTWKSHFNHHRLLENYAKQSPKHKQLWFWYTSRRRDMIDHQEGTC